MSPYAELQQHTLDVAKWAARAGVSPAFLHGTDLSWSEDQVTGNLVAMLRKDLLRHKVLDDVAAVPFTGTVRSAEVPRWVLVELPQTWWRRLTRRAPRTAWCPVVGGAEVAIGADTIPVKGVAKVRADYFRAFPEATIQYPSNLGQMRMQVHTSEPFDPTWKAAA